MFYRVKIINETGLEMGEALYNANTGDVVKNGVIYPQAFRPGGEKYEILSGPVEKIETTKEKPQRKKPEKEKQVAKKKKTGRRK